ncbi:RelA/SpoT family protein [Thiomicrorhabdus aquaedulcis]|uniref:RelA/SpoT family protein n=1 Tax=Thiomicrorhabdus aquaedulcis TaxID=2211106 RepID=UPI000FD83078|nr:bifunctional (p)ppGpp synthetase/guanosine-3',5'-bis(diphosphate) 3'-pyrophosphohydrolase [Thiomicrorhabdus aquaedulcis]
MTDSAELFKRLFKTDELTDTEKQQCKLACSIAIEALNLPNLSIVRSVDVALILANVKVDIPTLIATLLSDANVAHLYDAEFIDQHFDLAISPLVMGIRRLNQFKELNVAQRSDVQHERLRQMLLAMTSDIRIMLVKLAYRVARLRHLKFEDDATRHQVAAETQLVFAPLANRLGIAQLKWELEDLAFRYLHPNEYKRIALLLQDKRDEREIYIQSIISTLQGLLNQHAISAKISGRPKHIYSIWKKMSHKHVSIDALYDLRAVRIYVDNIPLCYEVLGLIHSHWSYVKQEFDDYIASPKENGYQSIHTVIIGPEHKTVEIQIRTHEMHRHAEYGVAAHWRYKEGGKNFDSNLERSISNVRQLLENNDDPEVFKEISTELQCKHIYVFTPKNEIITLRQGATPLDFAYTIHTELGHRCRGVKVNGRIQPLSYALQTGDKIEVLTVKQGDPIRNWLNPNLGYLTSSSARNKVRSWFNKQNKSQNIQAGEIIFKREIKRLNALRVNVKLLLQRFKLNAEEELFEAIGKGQISDRQLSKVIQENIHPLHKATGVKFTPRFDDLTKEPIAYVVGAANLRTQLAPCCQPQLGDDIVGFVTRGRGVTVHRSDCANMLNLSHEDLQRIIEVSWSAEEPQPECFTAELTISAFDRKGLLRDVMGVLTEMDINLTDCMTHTDSAERSVQMVLSLEIDSNTQLSDVLDQVERVKNIEAASITKI